MKNIKSRSSLKENDYQVQMEEFIKHSINIFGARNTLDNFAKYASRQSITRFLARDRIFRKILNIHGSIIECGVYMGQGVNAVGLSYLQFMNQWVELLGKYLASIHSQVFHL